MYIGQRLLALAVTARRTARPSLPTIQHPRTATFDLSPDHNLFSHFRHAPVRPCPSRRSTPGSTGYKNGEDAIRGKNRGRWLHDLCDPLICNARFFGYLKNDLSYTLEILHEALFSFSDEHVSPWLSLSEVFHSRSKGITFLPSVGYLKNDLSYTLEILHEALFSFSDEHVSPWLSLSEVFHSRSKGITFLPSVGYLKNDLSYTLEILYEALFSFSDEHVYPWLSLSEVFHSRSKGITFLPSVGYLKNDLSYTLEILHEALFSFSDERCLSLAEPQRSLSLEELV
ncbi:hypothetical protein J6590_029626 [Homalodisca vitripennis]|nr:hypothetical protein J6590_029626 [Homalodisca vitripennis]